MPAITPLLQDKDEWVAHAAGFALGSIGPGAASTTDALRKAIDGKDELEECVNSWALARIEPQNAEAREHAIKMLLETVKDKNPRVQSAAMRGLMDLKAPPKQLVPALAYVVLNGEEPAVGEVMGALGMLGDAATEVLDNALTRPEARGRARMLITYLGPKAKATVPALGAALRWMKTRTFAASCCLLWPRWVPMPRRPPLRLSSRSTIRMRPIRPWQRMPWARSVRRRKPACRDCKKNSRRLIPWCAWPALCHLCMSLPITNRWHAVRCRCSCRDWPARWPRPAAELPRLWVKLASRLGPLLKNP